MYQKKRQSKYPKRRYSLNILLFEQGFAVLIPPIDSIVERIHTLFEDVGVLRCELFGIVSSNDADEREVALDVITPLVLPQAPTEDVANKNRGLRCVSTQP